MALTQAERQARYRDRVKARPTEKAAATVERIRQAILHDFIREAQQDRDWRDAGDVERDVALLRRVADTRPYADGGFEPWLEGALIPVVEDQIRDARKAEKEELSALRKKWRAAERSEARRAAKAARVT